MPMMFSRCGMKQMGSHEEPPPRNQDNVKQHLPMGAVCVHVSCLIFVLRPGQLEYQEIGSHKVQIFETLKLLTNKGENKNQRYKGRKKLASGGTYDLKQVLEESLDKAAYSHLNIDFPF